MRFAQGMDGNRGWDYHENKNNYMKWISNPNIPNFSIKNVEKDPDIGAEMDQRKGLLGSSCRLGIEPRGDARGDNLPRGSLAARPRLATATSSLVSVMRTEGRTPSQHGRGASKSRS